MTTYASPRHARVIEITPEGHIVSVHRSENGPTRAINVTRLRTDVPYVTQHAFGVLSPSGEPPLVGIDPDQTAVLDALQLRFQRYPGVDVDVRPGRHRAPKPSPFARLFGRGRRDGV
jgi:hypothetical protein